MKQDRRSRQIHGAPPAPAHVGSENAEPLDGRQYVDVIEEQRYADSRPTLDTREPRALHVVPPAGGKERPASP